MYSACCRFYDVTGGSITVDGQDIRSVTQHSLRKAVGMVPQVSLAGMQAVIGKPALLAGEVVLLQGCQGIS